jgi:hypothetical protein
MSKDTYTPQSGNFLEGFTRVPRNRQTRMMSPRQRQALAIRESRVAAAAEFLTDLLSGATPAYYLQELLRPSSPAMSQQINEAYPGLVRPMTLQESAQATAIYGAEFAEAQTTSDFPLLVGDVLDRMMLQRFNEAPQVWRQYINVGRPLRDFRLARMIQTDGGDGQWSAITEEAGLTYTTLTESGHTITPALYGKAVKLSWRLLLNDDLDAFSEVPNVLGRGGRRTIHRHATDLLFDASGPDATFISAANGNLLTGNPALSISSLGTAIQLLAGFTDSEGEPIVVEGVRLVHGPGLRVTVQNILNQLTVDVVERGGTSNQTVRVNNWIVQGLTAVEDPYIPIIASTANGATSWLLAADPNVNRPAAKVRFLAGFDTPALYQKAPNTMTLGGGMASDLGDFQTMSQEWKGLVAFGGTTIEPKSVVGSNGSGS